MKSRPNLLIENSDYSENGASWESRLISSGNEDLIPLLNVFETQCCFDVDIDSGCRYFSIRAFCILNGIKLARHESQSIRAAAVKQSKAEDVWIICTESFLGDKRPQMYSESVLKSAFSSHQNQQSGK